MTMTQTIPDPDPAMLLLYEEFVVERHKIWERRQRGWPQPWTMDPVLGGKKFTNDFRILDTGSQFLFTMLEDNGEDPKPTDADLLMRAWLYRFTNRPEPWQWFRRNMFRWPILADLYDGTLQAKWQHYRKSAPLFGNAYAIVGGTKRGDDKLDWILRLAKDALKFAPIRGGQSTEYRVGAFQRVRGCSGFLAMQIATDLSYTTRMQASENSFVTYGPGSLRGARLLWPGVSPRAVAECIGWLTAWWWGNPDAPTLPLWGGRRHQLSLMDVQNTLCEFDKRWRWRDADITHDYKPAYPGPKSQPMLPKHW